MHHHYKPLLLSMSLLLGLSACQPASTPEANSNTVPTVTASSTAQFDWFHYQGMDPIFDGPLASGTFQNPVLAGFFPDPSIIRNGDDYYMTVSSFTYTPGLPILHSRDLVNWTLHGYALTRESQLDMAGLQVSRGIFAPTLRVNNGVYYIITTVVDRGGNFILTATDPAGPWSDPIWLPEVEGIDPDLFFDDDGRVYIAHNGEPEESLYEGHKAIWLWEYDLANQKIIADSQRLLVNGGVDLSTKPIWIEAPHIYKHDNWYYLVCAEGGTADEHSAVVFRSRSLTEPFVPYTGNPILTQRDLDPTRPDPITTAGHADFVQLPDGSWWAVFLASRAYQERFFNTGRETFLLPVTWKDGWPHILPAGETIPYRLNAPTSLASVPAAQPLTGNFTWRDDFTNSTLDLQWNTLRQFDQSWLTLANQQLQLKPGVGLSSFDQPSFVSRRQQHMHFEASTQMHIPAATVNQASAGIVAFQNETYHYYMGVRSKGDGKELFLEKAAGAAPEQIAALPLAADATQLRLKISGQAGSINFYYALGDGEWQAVSDTQDAKILSTQVATGFVGTMLGLHSRQETGGN
ncbi:glycoside hydrolase family 43 protein [Alishewanella tabrizica]|uniref:Xylosidase/arabinosidase n=1 Tax=Alishewanella tabrizica TaxID=671278 RepID=A0ABQ2WK37_9ALTE|nr:glycoside hydrolase family 43 protein [Alishewanella tabrizica]GGW60663.1 xylosidase/arabinosidase [Alishewanella tabrizica]